MLKSFSKLYGTALWEIYQLESMLCYCISYNNADESTTRYTTDDSYYRLPIQIVLFTKEWRLLNNESMQPDNSYKASREAR